MKTKYSKEWNLNHLFEHGNSSFYDHLKQLEIKLSKLAVDLELFKTPEELKDSYKLAELIHNASEIRIDLSQATSYITCLLAQNPLDSFGTQNQRIVSSIHARYDYTLMKLKKALVNTKQSLWDKLLETDVLNEYRFLLTEWREKSVVYLSDEEEELISSFMADGFHAWGHFYNSLISSIKITMEVDGEKKELSVGQAINLRAHPEEEVRKKVHHTLEDIWTEKENLFAKIINHIAGFRWQAHKKRGVNNILMEPLIENRLKEDTLNTMWNSVNKYKQPFANYLNHKAKMNGDKKLKGYNFWAPITTINEKIDYEDAVHFILENFSRFGTELEGFTRKAFEKKWIEAENRPNKSSIAFCASFPLSGESRIFMTYDGRFSTVLTLAHELGHAFHNYAMKSVNGLNRHYPMSMAETASIFSEFIILDGAIEKAETNEEKLFFLDEKLKRSVMNFMNIHSRFLFEKNFYEERKTSFVSAVRLNHLMKEALDIAYESSIEDASVHSWIWTPHFYHTKTPFYNFPYTVGYLFSLCLYAKAKEEGATFEKKYLNLLRESGSMSMEQLVMKHLGEDITSEGFWEKGIKLCIKDVDDFINLTSS